MNDRSYAQSSITCCYKMVNDNYYTEVTRKAQQIQKFRVKHKTPPNEQNW